MKRRWHGLRHLAYDAKPAWLCIGGVFVAFALAWLVAADAERRVQYAGVWLQIGGIVFVALGFRERGRLFELRPVSTRVAEWFGRVVAVVVRGGYDQRIAVGAATLGMATASGRARVVAISGQDASLEDRVRTLEQNAERFRVELDGRFNDVDKDVQRIRERVDREQAARASAEQAMATRLQKFAVGDLDQEIVGLVWLLLSTIATAIPADVVWVYRLIAG
jgi:hypothetical protein